ncbi:MAG: tripartite tricarboxylate transporter substrate binding protein [Sphaerochaeta sp.]|nr:tripartite tricarboxylate transporter substrate binding protein [Sphaerochaeta sp.]
MKKLGSIAFAIILSCSMLFAQGAPEASAASADMSNFPDKPVEAVVGWSAGGGGDVVFRVIAEVFPKYANGQPLVIKNVPGAAGITGAIEFLDARPNGYTVMHWNNASLTKTQLSKTPITATTFEPVLQVVSSYNYLLVNADAKWNTLQDFIDDAKANPSVISIGNAGTAGGNHMAAILFEDAISGEFTHIPFSGGGPSIIGLLGKQVDSAMNNAPEGVSNIEAGQLKMLAVFSEDRYPSFPDVPTAKEQGLDLVLPQWRGVVCPPGTPETVIQRLHDIFKQCIEDPVFIEKMKAMNVSPTYKNASDFGKFLVSEDARYEKLVKAKGLGDRY